MTTLLERWAVSPPGVLRSGGLGIRDLRAAASLLDVDEQLAALVVDVAWATGLLATSGETDDEWLPTPAYDLWRTQVGGRALGPAGGGLAEHRAGGEPGRHRRSRRLAGERPDPGRRTHRRSRHPSLGAARPRVLRRRHGSQCRLARAPARVATTATWGPAARRPRPLGVARGERRRHLRPRCAQRVRAAAGRRRARRGGRRACGPAARARRPRAAAGRPHGGRTGSAP